MSKDDLVTFEKRSAEQTRTTSVRHTNTYEVTDLEDAEERDEVNRKPREYDDRKSDIRVATYKEPNILPDVPMIPGWRHRWVAKSTMGVLNPTNWGARMREGWRPVLASDPTYSAIAELSVYESETSDAIEIGDLVLCRIPEEIIIAREEYYKRKNQNQIDAVDRTLFTLNDKRMPLFSEQTVRQSGSSRD